MTLVILRCTLLQFNLFIISISHLNLPKKHTDLHTEQCGQTKPLMFSMMPMILSPVFLQKVISLLTSPVDTACSQHKTRKCTFVGSSSLFW